MPRRLNSTEKTTTVKSLEQLMHIYVTSVTVQQCQVIDVLILHFQVLCHNTLWSKHPCTVHCQRFRLFRYALLKNCLPPTLRVLPKMHPHKGGAWKNREPPTSEWTCTLAAYNMHATCRFSHQNFFQPLSVTVGHIRPCAINRHNEPFNNFAKE